jgi:hypothetical protein
MVHHRRPVIAGYCGSTRTLASALQSLFSRLTRTAVVSGKVYFVVWRAQCTTLKADFAIRDWKQDCANDSKLA